MTIRVLTSSPEEKRQREEAQEEYEQDHRRKLDRTKHKGAGGEIELANIFHHLGLSTEFSRDKQEAFRLIPSRFEGKNRDVIKDDKAFQFLESDYGAVLIDDGLGRQFIHFEKGESEVASILSLVAEKSGQKRTTVREIYAALLKCIRIGLRKERKVRLPDLGILRIAYRPAKPKRKGISPFNKKPMVFKAKPASNKLKFRPAKKLNLFIANKIGVEPPPKK